MDLNSFKRFLICIFERCEPLKLFSGINLENTFWQATFFYSIARKDIIPSTNLKNRLNNSVRRKYARIDSGGKTSDAFSSLQIHLKSFIGPESSYANIWIKRFAYHQR